MIIIISFAVVFPPQSHEFDIVVKEIDELLAWPLSSSDDFVCGKNHTTC